MMENKIRAFRAKVTAIFSPTIVTCLLVGGLLIFAILVKESFNFSVKMLEVFLIFEAVLIPFIGLILLAITFDYKITVYKDGISSFDPFGNRKCDFMLWGRMNKIRTRNILGYRYLFIESNDYSETLWIPSNIKKKHEFKELVRSQAGADHPLSIQLMRSET